MAEPAREQESREVLVAPKVEGGPQTAPQAFVGQEETGLAVQSLSAPGVAAADPKQQTAVGILQRQAGNKPVAAAIKPERVTDAQLADVQKAIRILLDRVEAGALPDIQAAVDNVDEEGARTAALKLHEVWFQIEAGLRFLREARMGGVSPDLGHAYRRAWRLVIVGLTTQVHRGRPLLGAVRLPPYGEVMEPFRDSLVEVILEQSIQLTLVIADATALAELLKKPQLDFLEQWQAIGILRGHQIPAEFAYLHAVLGERGLTGRFASFATPPAAAYRRMAEAQPFLQKLETVGPGEPLRVAQPLVTERRVRLLQPLSLGEAAEALYGDAQLGRTLLITYNRDKVASLREWEWMPAGIELAIDPDFLVVALAAWFAPEEQKLPAVLRAPQLSIGLEPPSPGAAVVGNTAKFVLLGGLPKTYTVEWWIEPPGQRPLDSYWERMALPVSRHRIATKTTAPYIGPEHGPHVGFLPHEFPFEFEEPGTYVVRCLLRAQGEQLEFRREQTVTTLAERTDIEFKRHTSWHINPQALLDQARKDVDKTPPSEKQSDAYYQLVHNLVRMEEVTAEMAGVDVSRIRERVAEESRSWPRQLRAVYVSSEGPPLSIPLNLYVGADPDWKNVPDKTEVHLKLWDLTPGSGLGSVSAAAVKTTPALHALLDKYTSQAPFSAGVIRYEIDEDTVWPYTQHEVLTLPVPRRLGDMLKSAGGYAMTLGLVAAVVAPELVLPALFVSGILTGAGAAVNIVERLRDGYFEFDLQTGMDLLDIAAACLAGYSAARAVFIRGVGAGVLVEAGEVAASRSAKTAAQRLAATEKLVGRAQLALIGTKHVREVAAAVDSGKKDAVALALRDALLDGALLVVVHFTTSHVQELAARKSAGTSELIQTIAGGPRAGVQAPEAPGKEAPREAHDAWVASVARHGLETRRPAIAPVAEPTKEALKQRVVGTFVDQPGKPPAMDRALEAYEQALAAAGGRREVGIYYDGLTGRYLVKVGSAVEVAVYSPGRWEATIHYHPNAENVLTYRTPSPADVHSATVRAKQLQRPVTWFVDVDVPGGLRARTAYTVTPEGRISLEWISPTGRRPPPRTFDSLEDFTSDYMSRKRYVDPQSDLGKWMLGKEPSEEGGQGPEDADEPELVQTIAGPVRIKRQAPEAAGAQRRQRAGQTAKKKIVATFLSPAGRTPIKPTAATEVTLEERLWFFDKARGPLNEKTVKEAERWGWAPIFEGQGREQSERFGGLVTDEMISRLFPGAKLQYEGHGRDTVDFEYSLGDVAIVVESKGGASPLEYRMLGPDVAAQQGTREYLEATLELMKSRGGDEQKSAERLLAALKANKLRYFLVATPIPKPGQPLRPKVGEFDIKKRR